MAMEYADVGVGRDDCELPEVITEVWNARVGLREFDGADCNTWLRDSERKLADSGVQPSGGRDKQNSVFW
jgi:hypothetical protein